MLIYSYRENDADKKTSWKLLEQPADIFPNTGLSFQEADCVLPLVMIVQKSSHSSVCFCANNRPEGTRLEGLAARTGRVIGPTAAASDIVVGVVAKALGLTNDIVIGKNMDRATRQLCDTTEDGQLRGGIRLLLHRCCLHTNSIEAVYLCH
jgi:hypothetical protein